MRERHWQELVGLHRLIRRIGSLDVLAHRRRHEIGDIPLAEHRLRIGEGRAVGEAVQPQVAVDHLLVGAGVDADDVDRPRRLDVAGEAAALHLVDVVADRIEVAGGDAALDLHHEGDLADILHADPVRRQRQQRREAVRAEGEDQVVFGEPLAQLQDAPAADGAAFVGHGMGAVRHADALADHLVAVLGDHVPAGQPVAEDVLDGAGDALDALARAEDEDPADLVQVDHFVAGVRIARRLEVGTADDQLAAGAANQPVCVVVWIGGLEAGFHDLDERSAASDVAMRSERVLVQNPHDTPPYEVSPQRHQDTKSTMKSSFLVPFVPSCLCGEFRLYFVSSSSVKPS